MSTIGDIKVKAWAPAVPCKIPDNIVSSQYTSQKVFVPSYEKEKRPCIEQLLTNEYQRIWWQEKESWDKRTSRKVSTKKLLQRMVIRKKSKTIPVVDIPKKMKKLKKKKEEKPAEPVKQSKESPKERKTDLIQKKETTDKTEENKKEESS